MLNIFKNKIPVYLLLVISAVFMSIIVYLNSIFQNKLETIQLLQNPAPCTTSFKQIRKKEFSFTKPLLFTKVLEESENLQGLKEEIELKIQQLKAEGNLTDASVFVKLLDDGDWVYVNNGAVFRPGSVMKIVAALVYLKMCEKNPGLLEKEYALTTKNKIKLKQTFSEKPLITGRTYKAKELLYELIVNSDNDALNLIYTALDFNEYKKLFVDLEINEPDIHDSNFAIDARDLSKFLRILYNSTYLNDVNSEYCLSLLTKSTFSKGIVNELPKDLIVAHKFGETATAFEEQLHETGIIYNGDKPYVITIMTKGKKADKLAEAISQISTITYNQLKSGS